METICASIVTYNRKKLLGRCLDALLRQIRPLDSIIIIDNASTDGTEEFLRNSYLNNPIFDYARLDENTGCAGGFYESIKRASEAGHDWVLCMDDDGFPAIDALATLIPLIADDISALSCLVVSTQDHDMLSFSLPILNENGSQVFFSKKRKLNRIDDIRCYSKDGKTVPFANFYNGSLLRISAIREVGNVNRSLFIYGDEVDMMWRLLKVGRVITVIDAIHYHPPDRKSDLPLWKLYYTLRNIIYINRTYRDKSFLRNLNSLRSNLPRFICQQGGLRMYLKAVTDGFRGHMNADIRPEFFQ